MNGAEFVPLSLVPMLTGIFVAVACALPGNFLVLRRQALIGDAISHVVLPGIVVAFLDYRHGQYMANACWARRLRRWLRLSRLRAFAALAGSRQARPWA